MRKFLLLLVFLIGAAIAAIYWLLADPNRFKADIAALVERESGLKLDLAGDLSWRLWPPVRLVARHIAADWVATSDPPLVRVDTLELDADLWPLITGEKRLNVNGVAISGLAANLVSKDGRANWLPPGSQTQGGKKQSAPLPIAAAPADPSRSWAVDVVTVRDSRIDYDIDGERSTLEIDEMIVADLSPGRTSATRGTFTVTTATQRAVLDLRADVTATAGDVQLANGELTGTLSQPHVPFTTTFDARYDFGRERLDMTFDATVESFTVPVDPTVALGGASAASLAFAAPAVSAPATDPDAPILPLDTIRSVDWSGGLRIARLHYDGADFTDVQMTTSNALGNMLGRLTLPNFFGGSAAADVNIDARGNPRWQVTPTFTNVDSQKLLAWIDQRHDWVAHLLGKSELVMVGNTRRELSQSLKAHAEFDGGRGRLDIRGLRDIARSIAARAGGVERIEAWPELLDYQRFTGTWDADGLEHRAKVMLDNLAIELDGTLDPFTDAIDMAVAVTVLQDPDIATFQIDPLLMGLALPLRCKGTTVDPDCKADPEGTRKLLAQALSGENPELKQRLDKAIDEKVPEEYRDTARSLLDMLRQKNNN